jgi:endonuclease III-like uncharacterized protein
MMFVFLKELSKSCPTEQMVLVIDGAGFYKSKTLEILFLAP